MDSGLDFARALLEQLRLDLRRLAFGRLQEADRAIGRSVQYLRRVQPQHLRLDEAFAVMRFLGFRPPEYLDRMARRLRGTPPGALGFLRRHRLRARDLPALSLPHLPAFLEWAEPVTVEPDLPDVALDIEAWLGKLGLKAPGTSAEGEEVSAAVVYRYADFLFHLCVRHLPPDLSPSSARGLAETLLLLARLFPDDPAHFRAAAGLVDLGFRLEHFLEDLVLRRRLFSAAARISEGLGFVHDALWLTNREAETALWTCDLESARAARKRIDDLVAGHGLADVHRIAPDGPAPGERTDYLEQGRADQRRVFWVICSDRRGERGKRLRRLTGKDSFLALRTGDDGMRLSRWADLVYAANTTPDRLVGRTEPLDTLPLPAGGLLQRLKVAGRHVPKYSFQRPLLQWARSVDVTATAAPVGTLPEAFVRADQPDGFEPAIEGFRRMAKALPAAIRPEDARGLCEGLIRAGYNLGQRVWLDDAVDLTDAALHILDKVSPTAQLAFAYRMAGNLSIDLGGLDLAEVLLNRAKEVELSTGSSHGFIQTLYIEGLIFLLMSRFSQAASTYEVCSKAISEGLSEMPIGLAYLALASAKLQLRDLDGARQQILLAEEALSPHGPPPPALEIEILLVKAESLSRAGLYDEPMQLFDRATSLFSPAENPRELVLVGLEKCAHFIRFERTRVAVQSAKALLPLSVQLKRNPIGRQALMDLARLALIGEIEEASVRSASQRIRYPNVFGYRGSIPGVGGLGPS